MPDKTELPAMKDLWDFYTQWPVLRPRMAVLLRDPRLGPEERVILDWMMKLVDRAGPADLGR